MRQLLPTYAESPDLAEAYAYPPGRPWLRANMVASVDGAATDPSGLSGALSGPADRELFGVLRGLSDVVLVGASTVRAEGYGPARERPEFAERRAKAGQTPTPTIAILTGSLDLDFTSDLFATTSVRPIVITTRQARPDRLDSVATVADVIIAGNTRVDIRAAVDALYRRGVHRLLCEGGPHLLAEIAAVDRLDELCLAISPQLVAGDAQRILNGPRLPHRVSLELTLLLEDDGFLFAAYERTS
jgi:riboflavin biosynthesis pyrimidine reductase